VKYIPSHKPLFSNMSLYYKVRQQGAAYDFLWYIRRLREGALCRDSFLWWENMRNKHAGKRGFVIGNGPSLRMSDLDLLKDEVCIASNKIYLAFRQTSWRPSLLTCCDKMVWPKIVPDLPGKFDEVVVTSTLPTAGCVIPVRLCRLLGSYNTDSVGFSMNCSEGVYGGWTVTFFNLQIAVHLGLNPIYIIGCDHYYSGESSARLTGEVVSHSGASNHFSPDYRAAGEKVHPAPIARMNEGYTVARTVALRHGVKIFNATRGGHLEVFDRAEFDSVVHS
jgi:hypothetical protein